ncbi:hypothetical protein N2152v2_006362 [Parachlorella kessleri]
MAATNGTAVGGSPEVSVRVAQTDPPCIVKTKALVAGTPGALSLAQGVVHWKPPKEALDRATQALAEGGIHGYGADEGLPALRDALRQKIAAENGLEGYDVMVTAGANQGFVNAVLALVDASDSVVLFSPFYFNHLMALQMAGGGRNVVLGPCDSSSWHPDLDWLEGALAGPSPPKMVVITNPCNPTGKLPAQQRGGEQQQQGRVLLSTAELERASELCRRAGAWLLLDNTYEHFVYNGRQHHCIAAPHVLNLFSFSKASAYGMMGWRVGYLAFPEDGSSKLAAELVKIQDTVIVCATQLSQWVALGALEAGRGWVESQVHGLEGNRAAIIDALTPLGTLGSGVGGGEGAIYLWARLPPGCEDDEAVAAWLVRKHKVCLIPGSACGTTGHVRVAFANLQPELCSEAAARLKRGLEELSQHGMPAVRAFLESKEGAGAAA